MDGQVRIGFWLKPEGDVVVHAVCARGMTPPEVAEDIYRRGLSAEPSRSPPRIARDGTRVAEEANSQSVNEGSIPSGRTL